MARKNLGYICFQPDRSNLCLPRVLVATTRLIQFWWRNLNKANSLEVILNGSSPASPGAGAGGSWSLFLENIGLSTKPAPVEKPAHSRGRRGSMMGLMASLLEGGNMPRILALKNRHVRAGPCNVAHQTWFNSLQQMAAYLLQ